MMPDARADLVRRVALETGFDRVGIARAGPIAHPEYFEDWLARGRAGEMTYLPRYRSMRVDPRRLLTGARSVVAVAQSYHHGAAAVSGPAGAESSEGARGRVAQYAWGRDYHRVLRKKLHRLADRLHEELDETFETRVCVDTAPIMEREVAAAAGVGWIGKNTMVLNREIGSFFFLGEIVTTLELTPSASLTDHCGTCTRCLEACPTGALVAPYQMDATRCIAYLTIEHRGDITTNLHPMMGDWVFGCDVCQDVCPYNRHATLTGEPAYQLSERNPLVPRPLLSQLTNLSEAGYGRHLAGSAMKRATLAMLKRNAAIARANSETRG